MKALHWVIPAIVAAVPSFGQAPAPRVEFEVASIKPSEPFNAMSGRSVNVGVHIDGAQYHSNFLSIKDYIRIAYKVKDYQIQGPDWIASTRFDISAKIPSGVPLDKVSDMMQSLLADRFGVKLHPETKDFPVYGLIVMKGGAKLKESAPDAESGPSEAGKAPVDVNASGGPRGTTIDLGHGSFWGFADNKLTAKKLTMLQVAETLARYMDRPVIDMTDLKGIYDFEIKLTQEDFLALNIQSAVTAGINLPPEALKLMESSKDSLHNGLAALGLKLESRKAPLDLLVVDHAEKTPTEN
jgi:uncharacterized protein (TIGR03435 family)